MTERIKKIVSYIPRCEVFGDIGCDHGYASLLMLKTKKCKRAVFSDISEKCLSKAQTLLDGYVKNGQAKGYVSDGFNNIENVDCALIAGMGGEEIIKILFCAKNLPNDLILQPMKNSPKLREYLVNNGYKINKDLTFFSGNKYYNLITCVKGKDSLTADEMEFGRTNLNEKPKDFLNMIKEEIEKLSSYALRENITPFSLTQINERIERLKKVCC